jgi:histidinol phosphatase-like PHP family hydrolase
MLKISYIHNIKLINEIINKFREYTFLLNLSESNKEKIKYYKRKIRFLQDFFYFLINQNPSFNLENFLDFKKIDKNIYQKILEIKDQGIFKNFYRILFKNILIQIFSELELENIFYNNEIDLIDKIINKNLNNFEKILREFEIFTLRELNIKLKYSKNFKLGFLNFFLDIFNDSLEKEINKYIKSSINIIIKEAIRKLIDLYYFQDNFFYEIYFKFKEIKNYLNEKKIDFIITNSISRFDLNINEITFIIYNKSINFREFIKELAYNLNLNIYKIENQKLIEDDYIFKVYFYELKVPIIFLFSSKIFNILIYDLYFTYKNTINEEIFFKKILKIKNYIFLRNFIRSFSKTIEYKKLKEKFNSIRDLKNGKIYEMFYSYFNLNYIPPELSDYPNIIEISKNQSFSELVNIEDIKGDLHVHTNLSDGLNSIVEIVNYVKLYKKNYKYIGISDHINYLDLNKIKELKDYIKNNLNSKDLEIFLGVEENIDENGYLYYQKLDSNLDFINNIDFINASIHSNFNLPEDQQYSRLIRVIKGNNSKVLVISHLTTRILGIRDPINLNLNKILSIINELNKKDKYIEINCHLDRLDVDYNILREYRLKYNISPKVVISTDSHNVNHLDYMEFGVKLARKALIYKNDILNTKERVL